MKNNNINSNEVYINDYLKLRFELKRKDVVSITVIKCNGEILGSGEVNFQTIL